MGLGVSDAQPITLRKSKKSKVFKNTLLVNLFLSMLILFGVLMTPIFAVKQILVNGITHLSNEKIVDTSNIKVSSNIFLFRTSTAEQLVSNLSFVKKVEIKRSFPDSVVINIIECKPVAQVQCSQNLFLAVDIEGKILDSASDKTKYQVPTILNIPVNQFEVAKPLATEESAQFETLLAVSGILLENELSDRVENVLIEDGNTKIKFIDNITCDIGKDKNDSYRIKFIKEVIDKIPEGKTGVVEFIDEYKAVFKPYEKQK